MTLMRRNKKPEKSTPVNKTATKQEKKKEKKNRRLEPEPDFFHINLFFEDPSKTPVNFTLIDALLLILVTAVGLATHLLYLGEPAEVVFDEVYFANFTNYYTHGEYFFDIHPPLGKLLLFAGSRLLNYSGNGIYGYISQPVDKDEVKKLRIWPSITGALRSPVLFLALKLLNVNSQWCFTIAFMISMDNALIVESRFVLIDAYLSFFGTLSILASAYIARRPKNSICAAIICGMAVGCAVSVKFTAGGTAITLVLAIFLSFPLFKAIGLSIIAGISGLTVFLASFIIHFLLLPHPGPGCIYHPQQFCKTLEKGEKLNLILSTYDLIRTMLSSNLAIQATHAYSSKWWQWPIMYGKGTYMWVNGDRSLWCVGSPAVWFSGLIGLVLWMVIVFLKPRIFKTFWIMFGYLLSYLPFCLIQRVMWNYHYFIPLIFSLSAGAVAINAVLPKAYIIPALLCIASVGCWVIWFPITYATPLDPLRFKKIMFKPWVYH